MQGTSSRPPSPSWRTDQLLDEERHPSERSATRVASLASAGRRRARSAVPRRCRQGAPAGHSRDRGEPSYLDLGTVAMSTSRGMSSRCRPASPGAPPWWGRSTAGRRPPGGSAAPAACSTTKSAPPRWCGGAAVGASPRCVEGLQQLGRCRAGHVLEAAEVLDHRAQGWGVVRRPPPSIAGGSRSVGCRRASATSRDSPIPASPRMTTRRDDPSLASAAAATIAASRRSRPTRGSRRRASIRSVLVVPPARRPPRGADVPQGQLIHRLGVDEAVDLYGGGVALHDLPGAGGGLEARGQVRVSQLTSTATAPPPLPIAPTRQPGVDPGPSPPAACRRDPGGGLQPGQRRGAAARTAGPAPSSWATGHRRVSTPSPM